MTKILIDRATAEQTLEALDSENPDIQLKAALALRTALEQQQAKPVQEPVAWITPDGEGFRIRFSPPTSEVPLGWDALYTTPPLPVQPEPSSECNPQDLCAGCRCKYGAQPPLPVQEPVSMRMPKVGDKVICLEDESLGEVVSLTAGGSPDILFGDGSRGTYLLREFAELFGYVTSPLPVQEPPQYSFKAHWTDDKRIGVVACVTRPDGGVHLMQTIIDLPPAQPEQEPVAWMSSDRAWMWSDYSKAIAAVANIPTLTLIPLYVAPPMPVQEDAFEGWVKIDELREHFDAVGCGTIYKTAGEDRVPLYTAPPKHWQGLTDEEMSDIVADIDADFGDLLWKVVCLTKIIQAELKERNT